MTPLSIEIEGIRSFTAQRTIDFGGLKLFAIVGDTGSGKSSILEAMIYALFNGTTWDGKTVKELMSTNATRMRVCFRFELAGRIYTITRITPRFGAASHLLECDGQTDERRDGDRAIATRLKELLGVDREQFIKTVVLPQGEFAALLTLDPAKRATLLADVLGLGVIDVMVKSLENIRGRASALSASLKGRRGAFARDPAGALQAAIDIVDQITRDESALRHGLDNVGVKSLALRNISERARRRATLAAAIATIAPDVAAVRKLRDVDGKIQKEINKNGAERTRARARLAAVVEALGRAKTEGADSTAIAELQRKLDRLTTNFAEHAREMSELKATRADIDAVEKAIAGHLVTSASTWTAVERASLKESSSRKDAEAATSALQKAESARDALSLSKASLKDAERSSTAAASSFGAATAKAAHAKRAAKKSLLSEDAAKRDADIATKRLSAAERSWNALSSSSASFAEAAKMLAAAKKGLAANKADELRTSRMAYGARLGETAAKQDAEKATRVWQGAEKAWSVLLAARAAFTEAATSATNAESSLAAATIDQTRAKRADDEAERALCRAREALIVGERRNAAAHAAHGLDCGDACPICLRVLPADFKPPIAGGLDVPQKEFKKAESRRREAANVLSRDQARVDFARENVKKTRVEIERRRLAYDGAKADAIAAGIDPATASDASIAQIGERARAAEARREAATKAYVEAESNHSGLRAQVGAALGQLENAQAGVTRWRCKLDEAMADAKAAGIEPSAKSDASVVIIRKLARAAEANRAAAADARVLAERTLSTMEAQLLAAKKNLGDAQASLERWRLALGEATATARAVGIGPRAKADDVITATRARKTASESNLGAASDARMKAERNHSAAEAQLREARTQLTQTQAQEARKLKSLTERKRDITALRTQIPRTYLPDVSTLSKTVLARAATLLEAAARAAQAQATEHTAALQADRAAGAQAQVLDQRIRIDVERPLTECRRRLQNASIALATAGYAVVKEVEDSKESLPRAVAWSEALLSASAVAAASLAKKEAEDTRAASDAEAGIAEVLGRYGVASAEQLRAKREEALSVLGGANRTRDVATRALAEATTLDGQLAAVEPFARALDSLHRHLGDAKFKKFATNRKQDKLLGVATSIFRRMTGDRYGFGVDLRIVDRSASQARSPETLSGGEKFLASLALALALVEVARRSGRHFDALFLDEGFGSLDPQALDEALSELERQAESGRMIGVITHVPSVVEYIDDVLHVVRTAAGSAVNRVHTNEIETAAFVGATSRAG